MTENADYPLRMGGWPDDSLYGITMAAVCIEGRPPEPAQLSIWDVFAATPGRVTDNSHPSDGPAHLTYWQQDVQLLAELGINAYRLSLPWSALTKDPVLFDFYDRLLDALAAHQIAPVVTVNHYDMPLDVMERGGWLVRDTAEEFADWAGAAATRLADRVYAWVTMNSPLAHTGFGYGLGIEAPGLTLLAGALAAGQNQLIGHGLAVQALRTSGAARVGIANLHTDVAAASDSEPDRDAALLYDALHNRAFTDPLFGLPWPTELRNLPGAPADGFSAGDLTLIAAPLDFYGVNYYHPQRVENAPDNATIPFAFVDATAEDATDEFGWPIAPTALTATLKALANRYPDLPPIWVTENGTQDSGTQNGGLDDDHRGRFIGEHLDAVGAAAAAGVDIRGYFYWSLLDGWEFAEGFTRRFGLVAVDPATKQRRPKKSYYHYQKLLDGRPKPGVR